MCDNFPRDLFPCSLQRRNTTVLSVDSHWRWHENDTVASDEKGRNGSLCSFVNLFVCLLVDFHCCNRFLGLRQNHVQMLIKSLKREEQTYKLLVSLIDLVFGQLEKDFLCDTQGKYVQNTLTCKTPRNSRSFRSFTKIFSSRLNLIKSSGSFTGVINECCKKAKRNAMIDCDFREKIDAGGNFCLRFHWIRSV